MAAVANELHYADVSALYTAVGEGHVSAKHVVQRLLAELGGIEQAERIIEVHWAPSPSSVFLVAIQVEALDRHRLLSDVTRVLADEKVNILSASVTTSGDRVAISRFTFEMGDPKHLGHLLDVVRNVEGVYDVYRVTSAA